MITPRFALSALILIGALASAACSGAVTPAPATDTPTAMPAGAQPTPTPTLTDAPSVAPGSDGAQVLCAVRFEACPIAPGRYASQEFSPAFEFAIDTEWSNDRDWPNGGGISNQRGGLFWASDVMSGSRDGVEVAFDATPEALIGHLRVFDGFDLGEPTTIAVDGVEGTAIDAATRLVDAPRLYSIADDDFNLARGEKARFILLERDGRLVIITIEAFQETNFDAVLQDVQPVLDSWHWR